MATDIIARGMITEYKSGTNISFTENGDGSVTISASGNVSSEDTAARDAINNHKSDTSNPHNVTPTQIGLGNVDNTSDLDKPISTAVQKAIDNKADKTVATTSADGLMSASDKGKLDGVGDTYALKSKYGDTTIDVGRKAGTAGGIRSTAEGYNTTASGDYSHAEGASTTASGNRSHAEGYLCTASSGNSHAEGNNTTASGAHSHSEGDNTIASGIGSHAGGASSIASGDYSFAHGMYVESNNSCEVSLGKFNKSSSDTLFSIGDGTSDSARHNAFEITTTGGKLHDKDIATTDLIPTSLPANGGNADTVDNKHYTDFSQNAVLLTIEQVNDPNLESGIYSAENVSMSFSSDVASNWFMLIVNKHRASSGSGTQIAIPYDNGEQRGTFYRVCHAGNWGNWIRIADENIITNENLLLNPDFRINQQGKSVYTGTTECWDKWTINAGWETARSNDDLAAIFTCITPQINSWVVNQNIPNYKDYRGKTVTFSAQIVTASTKFRLMIYDGVDQLGTPVTTGHFSVTYRVSDNATALWCVISTDGQESLNEQIAVLSTKLELGTIATTFVPPNPSIEIAKVRAVNDDFVNANDRDQIQIPSNVDVPAWIYANGKRYKIYMTNGANIGMTNIPNDTTDYVWYWYDGINIIAREWAKGKYYICDVINGGFSGWKDVYTSGYKPFVTGTGTVPAHSSFCDVNLGFTPSLVLFWTNDRSVRVASQWSDKIFNTGIPISEDSTSYAVDYIAFK